MISQTAKGLALSAKVTPDQLLQYNLDGCIQKICKPSMSYGAVLVNYLYVQAIINPFKKCLYRNIQLIYPDSNELYVL